MMAEGTVYEEATSEPIPILDKDEHSDLTLVVEGKSLYVPSFLLKYTSPVFRAMLEGDFREKGVSEIPLPDKKYEHVLTYLKCIHPLVMQVVTEENVLMILPLAVEYQHTCLRRLCEDVMVNRLEKLASEYKPDYKIGIDGSHPMLDLLCTYIITAEKYNLKNVLEAAISSSTVAKFRSEELKKNSLFNQISCQNKTDLLFRKMDFCNKCK